MDFVNWATVGSIGVFALGFLVGTLDGRRKMALEIMEQHRRHDLKRRFEEDITRLMDREDDDDEKK